MTTVQAPVNVSPLIRFGRYTCLITGIAYGLFHYNRLEKKERLRRGKEEQLRVENAPRLAAEKLRLQNEELSNLEKAGLKLS